MVCVLHISTGQLTGLVVPYTVEDYHSWKTREADILLKKPKGELTKMLGTDKAFHVKWKSNSPKLGVSQIVDMEAWEETYASNAEVIEGPEPRFFMTGGGTFSVTVGVEGLEKKTKLVNRHLDWLARPLWNPDDKRTR